MKRTFHGVENEEFGTPGNCYVNVIIRGHLTVAGSVTQVWLNLSSKGRVMDWLCHFGQMMCLLKPLPPRRCSGGGLGRRRAGEQSAQQRASRCRPPARVRTHKAT